jgi:glyoxylase-like metal-dependent hydrolase (beta-lactamase superfamily II)
MSEIVYVLSALMYFAVAKVLTTYGHTTEDTGYYRSNPGRKVPYTRLLAVIIIGFVPVLNTFLAFGGVVFAAVKGFGPTPADMRKWFAGLREKKAKEPSDESESS